MRKKIKKHQKKKQKEANKIEFVNVFSFHLFLDTHSQISLTKVLRVLFVSTLLTFFACFPSISAEYKPYLVTETPVIEIILLPGFF